MLLHNICYNSDGIENHCSSATSKVIERKYRKGKIEADCQTYKYILRKLKTVS